VIGPFSASFSTPRGMRPLLVCAAVALLLAGCSDARKVIGLDRSTPDEFAVVPHAPLTLPPDLRSLPTPRPGVARPQEPAQREVARDTVFNKGKPGKAATASAQSQGGSALVSRAGAIDPDVRSKVDQETTALVVADKGWIDTLLFWQKQEAPYTIVDPKKEADRVRQAQSEGKSVAEGVAGKGVVPTIERKKKAPLEGIF